MRQRNDPNDVKIWSRLAYVLWMVYPIMMTIVLLSGVLILWSPEGIFGRYIPCSEDLRLILIVALSGGLGSTIRLLRIIPHDYRKCFKKEYINSQDMTKDYKDSTDVPEASFKSGIPFYILRPFLGPPVALIVYFAIRGGLLSAGTDQINQFGMAALAGLTGLFSDSAIDKLKRVFDELLGIKPESGLGESTE
jgi:hypothetical protein